MDSEARVDKIHLLISAIQGIFPAAKIYFNQALTEYGSKNSNLLIEAVGKESWFERAQVFESKLTSIEGGTLTRKEIKADSTPGVYFFYYEINIHQLDKFLAEVENKFIWPMFSEQFDTLFEEELIKKS